MVILQIAQPFSIQWIKTELYLS